MNVLTFPIGCTQIIFHKQTPLYIPELNAMQDRLTVSGQVNFASHLCSDGNTEMIAVVFHPYAMSAFLNVPSSLFYNREVSGESLGDKTLHELAEKMAGCEDDALCVGLVEQWLLSQITANLFDAGRKKQGFFTEHNLKRVAATIERIYAVPQTTVTELSSIACLSRKQYERLFAALVGMNPKEYAQIVRFQKALKLMQDSADWVGQAEIAYSCGYADQSHFVREFRRFGGHTPRSIWEECCPYSDLFTHPA